MLRYTCCFVHTSAAGLFATVHTFANLCLLPLSLLTRRFTRMQRIDTRPAEGADGSPWRQPTAGSALNVDETANGALYAALAPKRNAATRAVSSIVPREIVGGGGLHILVIIWV